MNKLKIHISSDIEKYVSFAEYPDNTIIIGRDNSDPKVNFVLSEDTSISRLHCAVLYNDEKYYIADLGSSNGTFYNKFKLEPNQYYEITNDAEIIAGNTKLSLVSEEQTAGEPEIEVTLPEIPSFDESIFNADDIQTTFSLSRMSRKSENKSKYDNLQSVVSNELFLNRYKKIINFSNEILHFDSIEDLIENVLSLIKDEIKSDVTGIIIFDKDKEIKISRFIDNNNSISSNPDSPISYSVTEPVLNNSEEILLTPDTTSRINEANSIMQSKIVSVICIPLIIDAVSYRGIIYNSSKSVVFKKDDLDFLSYVRNIISKFIIDFTNKEQRKEFEKLGSILSSDILSEIKKGNLKIERSAKSIDVSVMFIDINYFTVWSNMVQPKNLFYVMNFFFDYCLGIIFEHKGTIDKLIGDCVMAIFGAPALFDNHLNLAITCAVEIQKRFPDFKKQIFKKYFQPFEAIKVGIATGKVTAGFVGGQNYLGYTIYGKTVNLASRLCGMAEANEIICSAQPDSETPNILFEPKTYQLKNFNENIDAYKIDYSNYTSVGKDIKFNLNSRFLHYED